MMNPFNITFGKEPSSLISRNDDLEQIFNSFSSENPNSQVYIITGIRGSGKTVAMTTVSEYYEKNSEWICVELNPEDDMLEQLASKLYDKGKLKKIFLNTEFDISFKGISFSISGNVPITNVSTLLEKELEFLKKKNKRVLITIDEAISNSYMKIFVHEFQTFLRKNYNVCLLMTGLYKNISLLEKQKSLTFLFRAPKIYMGQLNIKAIANSYRNIFKTSEIDSIRLAKFTEGYAYAYQVLGNILYENKKTKIDTNVIDQFDEILFQRAYNIIYSELSEKEKIIINSSLCGNTNENIISKANITKSQLSAYKNRLVLKGILKKNREKIEFQLPRFKDFLRFNLIYDEIDE